jgi:hypothetical protein
MLSASNGKSPVTKLNNVTPHDHISIQKPLYVSSPLAISGHWNAGVPRKENSLPHKVVLLDFYDEQSINVRCESDIYLTYGCIDDSTETNRMRTTCC